VVVIEPQVGDPGRRSTGPKEPIPTARTGPSRSKRAIVRPIVSNGVVVGIVSVAASSPGPVPTANSHFVPPASIPPTHGHAVDPATPSRGRCPSFHVAAASRPKTRVGNTVRKR
jgi:hypothetical protein